MGFLTPDPERQRGAPDPWISANENNARRQEAALARLSRPSRQLGFGGRSLWGQPAPPSKSGGNATKEPARTKLGGYLCQGLTLSELRVNTPIGF
jgi:hypothetical protein